MDDDVYEVYGLAIFQTDNTLWVRALMITIFCQAVSWCAGA
uniref:Uncharacterized protein n=1 Tax=viral metagenome TaxID=1070528 RepID=A0A6C0KA52_9ZZZZ